MAPGELKGKYALYRFGYEEGRFSIFADTEKLKGNPLVSARDPVREAERHIGNFRLRPGMLALVGGIAHLPLIETLVEQLSTDSGMGGLIIAFEADTELYLALKKLRPEIFSQIAVIVPENLPVLAELVEKIDVEHFVGYRTFENRGSVALAPGFYAEAIGDFKKKLASRFSDLFTRLEFEQRWVFNALSKLPRMGEMRPVSALFGQGRGTDALLVSTGPSLRDSLPSIRAHQQNFFIACADSAYRVLVRAGITPHLVFSLDSQAHTAKHFGLLPKGRKGHFPILVCDAVSNPCVSRDWQGEIVLSFTAQYPSTGGVRESAAKGGSSFPSTGGARESGAKDGASFPSTGGARESGAMDGGSFPSTGGTGEGRIVSPGCDYLEEENFFSGTRGIIPGDLQSGGSVATSVFDLLRLMEFDRIILIGQDLAYTRREIHTPGTHHTDEWLAKTTNRLQPLENINERVIRRRHTKREISVTGRPIVTDYILSLYRDWFANAVQQLPQHVFNATLDGLKLPGAVEIRELAPQAPGRNAEILAALTKAETIQVNTDRIAALGRRIHEAQYNSEPHQSLSFLRYVGRKFAISALRSPEKKDAFLKKQQIKQRNFLRKLDNKLYHG